MTANESATMYFMEVKSKGFIQKKSIMNKIKSQVGEVLAQDMFENKKIKKTYTGALY